MSHNQQNFERWYVDVLKCLYPRRSAGFAIMMIVFPLLERYVRQIAGLAQNAPLNDAFYGRLVQLFPELASAESAAEFWQVFRNGLLHEVTMSVRDRRQKTMPRGELSHDMRGLLRDAEGHFAVNPVDFATRVVEIIQGDFDAYEGAVSVGRLPTVSTRDPAYHTSTVMTGTSTGVDYDP